MKHIYPVALDLINRRIKSCGKGLANSQDPFSIHYWLKEIAKAELTKSYIENRMGLNHNVIYVDFKNKRKAS